MICTESRQDERSSSEPHSMTELLSICLPRTYGERKRHPGARNTSERVADDASCMHEQFHCAERLFQQRFIGTEVRIFYDTSPQRIMKCDAGTHEGTRTCVVLSGDTTMFPSFGECVPNELTVSA